MGFWSKITAPLRIRNISSRQLLQMMGIGLMRSASGIHVTPESALRCAAVYACIRVLAESVAQLPLHVYFRNADGGKKRADRHSLASILDKQPNEWQTAFEFREMLMGHLCLRGNAYCLISRSTDGRVLELIPLHPDGMEVRQETDYTLSYAYTNFQGRRRELPAGQVWHLRGLSGDGVMGLSPIALQREAIGLSLVTERHGASLFGNGVNPSGVLKHPKTISEEAIKKLRRQFQENYAGPDNAHRPMLLEEGMEWVRMGMSNEDSQFLETRQYQRTEIASIFRVPPHKIGDLTRATFSNIEQQSIDFVIDSLLPWLRRWEQAIWKDLLRAEERPYTFAQFVVEGLLRGDTATRYAAYQKAILTGWMNRNEVRRLENLNPVEGLDEFLTPTNMATGTDPVMPGSNTNGGSNA